MARLSDDDFRELLGMEPRTHSLIRGNLCGTCGGVVSRQGICFRCYTDHSEAMRAQQLQRNTQVKPRLSAAEIAARLACLKGQNCYSCFHGQLDEKGKCNFCEYLYTDYHDIAYWP